MSLLQHVSPDCTEHVAEQLLATAMAIEVPPDARVNVLDKAVLSDVMLPSVMQELEEHFVELECHQDCSCHGESASMKC